MSRILNPSFTVFRGLPRYLPARLNRLVRNYADTPKSESKNVLVKVQGTDAEQRVRVRLARASDVPRVLRFVREQARAWPGALAPPSGLVLGDYVARILAQGHSVLAEQHPHARSELRGLALSAAVCPWDAGLMEDWARCLKCKRSRRFIHFSAHCLRAPKLHEKYGTGNMLQVSLIVPPATPKSVEIAKALVAYAVKRGKEADFPLVRFDATQDFVANTLDELPLTKEWYLSYDITPEAQTKDSQKPDNDSYRDNKQDGKGGNFVAVYTKVIKK